jgi:hypothetical protein
MPLLSQATADLVASDSLSRVATADDNSRHVLYLDGDMVRSMLAVDWPPPLPTEPTKAEIDAAIAARAAARLQAGKDAAALRQKVLTTAQSAVGISVDALTAGQVRALVALLLYQQGALDKSGVVQPLAGWVR